MSTKYLSYVFAPLYFLGWVLGFLFRFVYNGFLHGICYFELKEQQREQDILQRYNEWEMAKEEAHEYNPYDDSDSQEGTVPPTIPMDRGPRS